MSNGVWTNNWKGLKNAYLFGISNGSQNTDFRAGWNTILNKSGTRIAPSSSIQSSYLLPISPVGYYWMSTSSTSGMSISGSGALGIAFGTGTSTPTATDYSLAAEWTSGCSYVSFSQSNAYDDTTYTKTKTVTVTVQNVNSASVTIREWGIFGRYAGNDVLLYHAALDTPVTLQQYESATFTCTVSMRLTDPI